MSKPILCSEIISAFTQPKRALALYQGGRIADDMIRKKQADLVKSQKFVLSESLVENAFDVSMQKPSVLLEMMESVKIPFDNIFIEWNEEHRQQYMKTFWRKQKNAYQFDPTEDYPERVGYHINKYTDPMDDSYFLYESYYFIKDLHGEDYHKYINNKFYSPTMCMIIHDEEMNFEDEFAKVEILDEIPKDSRISTPDELKAKCLGLGAQLLGNWYFLKYCPESLHLKYAIEKQNHMPHLIKMINYNKSHEFNCFKEICYRLSSAQSASMHWALPEWKFKEGYTGEEMALHEQQWVHSTQGDARFIISLFSLLNQNLTNQTIIRPDNKIIHTKLGKRVPRNDYKVLNIDLTKNKIRKIYKSTFKGKGNPKRQHERRGHFRHLRDIHGNVKRKIWIKSCIAGSAEHGVLMKDYNLK